VHEDVRTVRQLERGIVVDAEAVGARPELGRIVIGQVAMAAWLSLTR